MAKKIDIKNYTSSVPVEVTIGRIEKLLVSAGANNILKQYNSDQELESIQFSFVVNGNTNLYRLEAHIDIIEQLFIESYTRPTERSYEIAAEQAERCAWKIIYDWVEIQITMIKLDQMKFEEAFWAKTYNPATNKTLYQSFSEGHIKLLPA
jgi:hypothetical protein